MKRILPLVIIIAVALITAGAGIWLYRSKVRSVAPASAQAAPDSLSQSQPEKLGGPHLRGPVNAPLVLEIYGDFQCPPCATTTVAIDQLEKEYGSRLRLIFHEFPLAMHAHALEAAMVAEAAGAQGDFWEMHDMLYQNQSVWSNAADPGAIFATYARKIGLDTDRFEAEAKAFETRERIMAEGKAGVARGVRVTPTIFINGKEVRGFTKERLQEEMEAVLSKESKT